MSREQHGSTPIGGVGLCELEMPASTRHLTARPRSTSRTPLAPDARGVQADVSGD